MKRTHPVKLRADKEEINTLHTCVENDQKSRGTEDYSALTTFFSPPWLCTKTEWQTKKYRNAAIATGTSLISQLIIILLP